MSVNLDKSQRSKAAFVAVVLGAAAIEGTVFAKQHHVPTGNDAFLHYQVDSTDELITALKNNPTLRRNYARHFGIPENQVVDFVKRTLIPYRLPTGRTVNTYGVTKSGRIYPVKAYLRKGTLVWATRSGLPVLKWACANPLTSKLPGTLLSSAPRPIQSQGLSRKPPALGNASSPEVAVAPINPLASVSAPILSAPMSSVTSAEIPLTLSGSGAISLPAIASVPIPVSAGGGTNINSLLPLLPILVGTTIGGNSGGGGGGGGGGGVTTAPEPGSLVLLAGAGLPIIVAVVRKRRQSARSRA